MRGWGITLIICLTFLCLWSEVAYSFQFEERALRIVGGNTEDDEQLKPSADETPDGNKWSPQPSPTAFMKNTKPESSSESTRDHEDDKAAPKALKKRQTPKLRLGMGSSALNKFKSQSSKLFSVLAPLSVAFAQLFVPSEGKPFLTKTAIYALALLGASSGFHLFLYFITVGYCCGVTLPVLVALIVYNVS